MRIPAMSIQKKERQSINAFGGYDRRDMPDSALFFDMKNMTGDKYPYLAPRKERGVIDFGDTQIFSIRAQDIYYGNKLRKNALIADCTNRLKAFYEEDGAYVIRDIANTSSTLTQAEKLWVASNAKFYFFPDNVCYDLIKSGASPLDHHGEYALGYSNGGYYEMVVEPCGIDGSDSVEESPYRRIKRRSYDIGENGLKGEEYTYMAFTKDIEEGDTLKLSGFADNSLNIYCNIKTVTQDRLSLVIESTASLVQSEGVIYLDRKVPVMDHVIACANRLWGCRYGLNNEGVFVNEIYACALGDATNWYKFTGTSQDSYTVSIGGGGSFTGACVMDGCPVFFKEDMIIKIYGSYPGEYCVVESPKRGIEAGSEKSAVFVNDRLYYKSYDGIVEYDGGVPVNVDAPLGDVKYKNAVAGALGDKYYISMENGEGQRELFVYDTQSRSWHKEDSVRIKEFCRCREALYFICEDEDGEAGGRIWCAEALSHTEPEGAFEWMCESQSFGYKTVDHKYLSSLGIRMKGKPLGGVSIYIEYDGNGVWHKYGSFKAKDATAYLRVSPRRCSSFRVRMFGRGECCICSFEKTVEEAGPHRP